VALAGGGTEHPLVWLTGRRETGELDAEAVLADVPSVAAGIGPSLTMLQSDTGVSTGVAELAHKRGLWVHAWVLSQDTVTPDVRAWFDPAAGAARPDGIFCDYPAVCVSARRETRRVSGDGVGEGRLHAALVAGAVAGSVLVLALAVIATHDQCHRRRLYNSGNRRLVQDDPEGTLLSSSGDHSAHSSERMNGTV
jgi:hypothetical protein